MDIDFMIAQFYGGTGLLIVVSVALDLVQKIDSHLVMRNYSGLLDCRFRQRVTGSGSSTWRSSSRNSVPCGLVLKSRREIGLMREGLPVGRRRSSTGGPDDRTPACDDRSELDAAVEELFASHHAAIPLFKGVSRREVPFPAVTCISVNEEVVHGIPGRPRVLEEGDIVSVDTGCKLGGWCGDGAWTYPVGQVTENVSALLEAGQNALQTAIQGMGNRKRWSEVARMIESSVDRAGFSVVLDLVGHGIGREMHEEPEVPNYVPEDISDRDFPIKNGLVLAIEPMVNMGGEEVCLLDDHWTIVTADGLPSVHFEHTVAMTAEGPVVLTEGIGKPM